jgi:hypothetical protein
MNKISGIVIVLTFLLPIILSGCTTLPELPINERSYRIGTAGFVPRNFPNSTGSDWQDFFNEVPKVGEVFGDYVSWDDLPYESGIPEQIHTTVDLCEKNGMTPVIAIGYNLNNVDEGYFNESGQAYLDVILTTVDLFQPEYLAIGVEVNNLYFRKSPEVFDEFVSFYKDSYDKVKQINQETKVFTIFQLEHMKGAAYLSGIEHPPQWDLIEKFDGKLDIVGFTVYPFLEYTSVADIPSDYYTEITTYTNKPIAFTEMGWPSNLSLINSSEQEQVHFLLNLLEQTKGMNIELFIQSFLHDAHFSDIYIFDTVGLKMNNGDEKLIYDYWLALKNLDISSET